MVFRKSNKSGGFFDIVFLLLALILLFIFAGIFYFKSNQVQKASVEDEYKAQQKFMQLQSSVDSEDYTISQFILSDFQRDYSKTNFYKQHSKLINEDANTIKSQLKDIKMEDKIEYVFIPPRPESKMWKEFMSGAERMVSHSHTETGIAVLRVIFEDDSLESPSVRVARNSDNVLSIFYPEGGFSSMRSFKSGDSLFVGSYSWHHNLSDPNDKNVSVIGDITIGGIYHYPIKLKIAVQKGKAVPFGEVIVRTIPKKFCGNLKVDVNVQEDAKLKDMEINLSRSGSYYGITLPLKDGSCQVSSVGQGDYDLRLISSFFGSADGSVSVSPGQTTKVMINAYRHRMIELDWRFRRSNEPNNWTSGRKIIKTKNYWQPDDEWNVHYPVVEIGDWIDNACNIRKYNGDLMRVDTDVPFEKMNFPLNFGPNFGSCPVKQGDVFAWQDEDNKHKGVLLQALIRIGEITPVKLPKDPNSPVQKKKSY